MVPLRTTFLHEQGVFHFHVSQSECRNPSCLILYSVCLERAQPADSTQGPHPPVPADRATSCHKGSSVGVWRGSMRGGGPPGGLARFVILHSTIMDIMDGMAERP